jgi:hypothetical protein
VNHPLVEPKDTAAADRFTAMAKRIEQNADQPFGGAVVIVPPSGASPIEMLMLDPASDLAMFWATIKTKIEILLATAEAEKRRQSGFGSR